MTEITSTSNRKERTSLCSNDNREFVYRRSTASGRLISETILTPIHSQKYVHTDTVIKRINNIICSRNQKLHITRKNRVSELGQYHIFDKALCLPIKNVDIYQLATLMEAIYPNEKLINQ
jgi:hypothetical protein